MKRTECASGVQLIIIRAERWFITMVHPSLQFGHLHCGSSTNVHFWSVAWHSCLKVSFGTTWTWRFDIFTQISRSGHVSVDSTSNCSNWPKVILISYSSSRIINRTLTQTCTKWKPFCLGDYSLLRMIRAWLVFCWSWGNRWTLAAAGMSVVTSVIRSWVGGGL